MVANDTPNMLTISLRGRLLFGPGDEIELVSIDVRFPLAMLYRGTAVPEMPNDQDERQV